MNSVTAKSTGVRMSPRKVGEVISLVRNRTVSDALEILKHTPRRATVPVIKLINSASANAQQHGLRSDSLIISSIHVGPGIAYKRYRPAAHGRALPYKKQSANVAITLSGVKRASRNTAKKKAANAKSEATKTTTKNKEG